MNFARVLDELMGFFADHELRWAVIGGVAMAAYGLPRTTLDLDFVAERSAQDAIVGHLEAQGYRTLYRSEGYSNHQHDDADLGRVDFAYVSGETAKRLFAQARQVPGPGGSMIRVPNPEHVAAMKVHAMASDSTRKTQELADLRFLLTLSDIDREAVREQFVRRGLEEEWNELAPKS